MEYKESMPPVPEEVEGGEIIQPMFTSMDMLRGTFDTRATPPATARWLWPMTQAVSESRFRFEPAPSADSPTVDVGLALVELANLLICTLNPYQARQLLEEVRTLTDDPRSKIEPDYYRRVVGEEPPSHGEQVELRVGALLRAFGRRRAMLADSLSEDELYRVTGVRPELYGGWDRKPRRLLAINDFGEWRFPTFQFDPDAADGVVAGLVDVLAALEPVPIFSQLAWFLTEQPELDGVAPWLALQRGQAERVLSCAGVLRHAI